MKIRIEGTLNLSFLHKIVSKQECYKIAYFCHADLPYNAKLRNEFVNLSKYTIKNKRLYAQ